MHPPYNTPPTNPFIFFALLKHISCGELLEKEAHIAESLSKYASST